MKNLGGKLLGDAGRVPFEQRIFHFAMLLAVGLTLFGTVMDVYYLADIRLDLVFLGLWMLTYYFSRVKNWFRVMSAVSMAVYVFGFVPFLWIGSGGVNGVIPYYAVLFMAFVCLVLKGPYRIAMACSLAAVVLLLVVHDALVLGSFSAAVNRGLRPIDFLIHLGALLAASSVLLIVYSNTYQREKERGEAYARTIEEHYHAQLYYMQNLEQLIARLKSDRHDFNNHLGVIYSLLEGGEPDQARDYAAQLEKKTREYQTVVNIPYPMVRAMLNYKLAAAREAGVELRLDVSVPDELALDEFDVTAILGNLLDNAMEACAAVSVGERYLKLDMRYEPDYLVIQTENPVSSGLAGGTGRSTKPDAVEHGFGLKNIEYLAARHHGFLQADAAGRLFRANVALLVRMRDND